MKNIKLTGFMASLLMTTGVAFADEADASLTTKKYVDAGLRAVYQVADGAATDAATNASAITNLQSSVSEHADAINQLGELVGSVAEGEGLAYDVSVLQSTVNNLDGVAYSGTNGVTVSDHQVGLDVEAEEGNMYVYTTEGWQPLPVENTWDSSILN